MSWLRRPEAALFALVLGCYAYFYQAGGWNQNSRFDMVRAIVEHGTVRIDRYEQNTGDEAKRGAHYYCDKAPGAQWLAVPAYAVVHAVTAPPAPRPPSPWWLAWAAWASTLFAVGVPSALGVVAFALLLRRLGATATVACAAAAAYGLATLAFPYSTLLYGHQLVASLLLIALLLVMADAISNLRLFAVGLLLGYAIAVEYPAVLACLPIGGLALYRHRLRALWIVGGALLPGIAVAAYHQAAFGGPLTLPYEFSTQKHRHMGFFMGLGKPQPQALRDILVTSYRGLFWSAPWLLLAIPGAVRLVRRGHGALVATCVTIFVLFVWLNASLVDWQGGWAMGARYLVPAIPFVALLAAGIALPTTIDDRKRTIAAIAIGFVVVYSGFLMMVGVAVKPEVPTNVRHPYGEFLLPKFRRGELAVSTQGIDMMGNPEHAPRQAWNLGHKLGLDGRASLIPLALWMIGCGAAISVLARRAPDDRAR